VTYLFNFK